MRHSRLAFSRLVAFVALTLFVLFNFIVVLAQGPYFQYMPVLSVQPTPAATPKPTPKWELQTVDASHVAANMNDRSLALDADGNPHIAYGKTHLYYASFDGTQWNIDTVDGSNSVGEYASLALDSNGYAHISYYDAANKKLKYAHWTDDGWDVMTVDSAAGTGMYSAIAVDNNNRPHIAYQYNYTTDSYYLKYARWNGYYWVISTIDYYGNVGPQTHISIAIDHNNYPHISYLDDNALYTENLKYVHYNGSSWLTEVLDVVSYKQGAYSSIAIDSNNNPHISFTDATKKILKYISWDGSAWKCVVVDSSADVPGLYNSLALDSADQPHIAYYTSTSQNLKYAYWNGSQWVLETLDSAGNVGVYPSLALDPHGWAMISYYDQTRADVKFIRQVKP